MVSKEIRFILNPLPAAFCRGCLTSTELLLRFWLLIGFAHWEAAPGDGGTGQSKVSIPKKIIENGNGIDER
ncbi:hypothetical protein MUG91_G68n1 [Manis pentadactyla]|nr:hypothetical protein MUG91_G68n1 [Manis pentadactyla]